MEISELISISQSLEKIWNFWKPVSTDVQWRSGITKTELTSPAPYGVGSSEKMATIWNGYLENAN